MSADEHKDIEHFKSHIVQEIERINLQMQNIAEEQHVQRELLNSSLSASNLQVIGTSSLAKDVADLKVRLDEHSFQAQPNMLPAENGSSNQPEGLAMQQQELITRLTKVEAALSEGSVRDDRKDIEVLEPDNRDAEVLTTRERASAAIRSQRTYTFQESVYDAVFFAFVEHLDGISSFFAIIGFLLNMALQVGVLHILKRQFTIDPLEDGFLDSLRRWRQSEGHSHFNADPLTGVSLAARVCEGDPALHVSGNQMALVTNTKDYLGDQNGKILCTISIVLWTLTCAFELRRSLQLVWSLLGLQVTAGSMKICADSDGLHVFNVSYGRLLTGLFVALCRSTMAMLLLIYGSQWLAYTISIEDLLLNASALGFVLDIDEIVFGVLSPAPLIGIIASMQPLRLPTCVFLVPSVMVIGVVASVICVEVSMADYIRTRLQLADDILCHERTDLNFIIGTAQAGWIVVAKSTPFEQAATELVRARRWVAQLRIDKAPGAGLYSQNVSGEDGVRSLFEVQKYASMEFPDQVNSIECQDLSGHALGARLFAGTGLTSLQNATSCVHVAGFCRGAATSRIAQTIRMWCPITCGCADPLSGLWDLVMPSSGCPWKYCRFAMVAATMRVQGPYTCEDTPLGELQVNSNWHFMLGRMHFATDWINATVFNNLSSIGCPAFQALEFGHRQHLCGTKDIFQDERYAVLGAGLMCPESCACIYTYMDGPHMEELDDEKYIPGNSGLCPRVTCADKYMGSAQEYCVAKGLQVAPVRSVNGDDFDCVA